MHRFFTDDICGNAAFITGDDVRHMTRVLRLRPGDAVTLCDGRGYDYDGVIASLSEGTVVCAIDRKRVSATEPLCRVTLFQCLPKTDKMETIVQKCTELGVDTVVPVVSTRCVALPSGNFENKRVRLQRVAEEAAKQSRRGVIPRFLPHRAIASLDPGEFDLFLVAYEDESRRTLKSVLKSAPGVRRVGILIGPEGGFASEEIGALTERGAISVSLGARILRTETAGMAMLAELLYELEPEPTN